MKANQDDRLSPTHMSLYHSLFQLWNLNHFKNPIFVNRIVLSRYSKIGSNHTLYKCLKELSEYGYIHYEPSFSPQRNSSVKMVTLYSSPNEVVTTYAEIAQVSENTYVENAQVTHHTYAESAQVKGGTCVESAQVDDKMNVESASNLCKIDIAACAKMHSYIDNIYTEDIKSESTHSLRENQTSQNLQLKSVALKRKKVAQKKENKFKPPELEIIIDFFIQNGFESNEGKKFYYHYQSNGWKVGGKSAMSDWQSAAMKWMLNFEQFKKDIPNKTTLNLDKDYGEPL